MNNQRRTRTAGIAGLIGLVAVVVGLGGPVPSGAAEPAAPAPIAVELLSPRSTFTDDVRMQVKVKLDGRGTNVVNLRDPSQIVVARITVQPGARFPWHTHPGPVLVAVEQGGLTYVNADDCVERHYPVGTAFVDPGQGNVHTAFNGTGEVTVLYATFLDAPAAGPLTVTEGVVEPADCQVEVGAHTH